jgi:hypothetical protein
MAIKTSSHFPRRARLGSEAHSLHSNPAWVWRAFCTCSCRPINGPSASIGPGRGSGQETNHNHIVQTIPIIYEEMKFSVEHNTAGVLSKELSFSTYPSYYIRVTQTDLSQKK